MLSAALSTVSLSTQDGLIFCGLNPQDSIMHTTNNLYKFSDMSCVDVVTFCFSPTRKYLAVTDSTKKLLLYNFANNVCVKIADKEIPRCAACVTFTQDEQFVVFGEKSGNVYKLSIPDLTTESNQPSLDVMLGHLSILSDIAVSYDGKLLATCDRDGKIRISRFQQPFVIEAFCLGHSCFISQLTFLPRSYLLVSAGGDGYLRLWQSETGTQLSCIQLTLGGETKKVEAEENSLSVVNPVIIHRLFIAETDICVCSSSSHPVAFVVRIHTDQSKLARWGTPSRIQTPGNRPLLDSALCIVDSGGDYSRIIFIGLTSESTPYLVFWSLSSSTHSPDSFDWKELQVVNPIPESLLKLPDPIPRLELLKSLAKREVDRSMIETYEENKRIRHQNVLDRRLRHQQKRQAKKHQKQSVPPGTQGPGITSDIL
ncbi:hypothetical protein CRM22_001562 [Opisthorchis felineus]|uniref:tRNA (guanine-N(7)-)-methyltransferase non-catalytic subunit n=1 Tax=Opisthorchis felineus TaxID=147828 RepID=A0A4S2MEE3_OPIFE|nr:hypothetical protein CRM22_001562 [Opisthorchis felineus]